MRGNTLLIALTGNLNEEYLIRFNPQVKKDNVFEEEDFLKIWQTKKAP